MIDLHCHLDLYSQPRVVASECVARGMYVLSMTTVPSAFAGTAALADGNEGIHTALGLHPELAATRERELSLFEELLPRTRYVGEVGLDGSRRHRSTLDRQKGVLNCIFQLSASAGGRIMSVHSRGAISEVLDLISLELRAGTFILHWFLGSRKQIAQAVEMGCWFSVGPGMVSSQKGLRTLAALPRDRVLPESDGPFGKLNGQPALPWDSWSIIPALASAWGVHRSSVERSLEGNFRSLLGNDAEVTPSIAGTV